MTTPTRYEIRCKKCGYVGYYGYDLSYIRRGKILICSKCKRIYNSEALRLHGESTEVCPKCGGKLLEIKRTRKGFICPFCGSKVEFKLDFVGGIIGDMVDIPRYVDKYLKGEKLNELTDRFKKYIIKLAKEKKKANKNLKV